MKENLYKRLPPLERRPDGSLYRMTPAQRKQANSLIRREAAAVRTATASFLTMGTPAPARRRFLSRSAVSGSAGRFCRWTGRWKWRFSGIRTRNDAPYADKPFSQNPTGGNTARIAPPGFTGGRKRKVNGKGGRAWTVRRGKSLYL